MSHAEVVVVSREIAILTPEHVELKFELAGLGSRFLAILLDTLLQTAILLGLALIFFVPTYAMHSLDLGSLTPWMIAVLALVIFAVWGGYFLFYEATRNGQTPGKRALSIRVIRDSGHPIDSRAAVLRNVTRFVDMLPAAYGIGCVSILISPEYRRLGDYIAGTLVVKTGRQVQESINASQPVEHPLASPTPAETDAAPSLLPPEALAHLSDVTKDDYRALRHFLGRRLELDETVWRPLAGRILEPLAAKLHIEPSTLPDPIAFLEALEKEWERRMTH